MHPVILKRVWFLKEKWYVDNCEILNFCVIIQICNIFAQAKHIFTLMKNQWNNSQIKINKKKWMNCIKNVSYAFILLLWTGNVQ